MTLTMEKSMMMRPPLSLYSSKNPLISHLQLKPLRKASKLAASQINNTLLEKSVARKSKSLMSRVGRSVILRSKGIPRLPSRILLDARTSSNRRRKSMEMRLWIRKIKVMEQPRNQELSSSRQMKSTLRVTNCHSLARSAKHLSLALPCRQGYVARILQRHRPRPQNPSLAWRDKSPNCRNSNGSHVPVYSRLKTHCSNHINCMQKPTMQCLTPSQCLGTKPSQLICNIKSSNCMELRASSCPWVKCHSLTWCLRR